MLRCCGVCLKLLVQYPLLFLTGLHGGLQVADGRISLVHKLLLSLEFLVQLDVLLRLDHRVRNCYELLRTFSSRQTLSTFILRSYLVE